MNKIRSFHDFLFELNFSNAPNKLRMDHDNNSTKCSLSLHTFFFSSRLLLTLLDTHNHQMRYNGAKGKRARLFIFSFFFVAKEQQQQAHHAHTNWIEQFFTKILYHKIRENLLYEWWWCWMEDDDDANERTRTRTLAFGDFTESEIFFCTETNWDDAQSCAFRLYAMWFWVACIHQCEKRAHGAIHKCECEYIYIDTSAVHGMGAFSWTCALSFSMPDVVCLYTLSPYRSTREQMVKLISRMDDKLMANPTNINTGFMVSTAWLIGRQICSWMISFAKILFLSSTFTWMLRQLKTID